MAKEVEMSEVVEQRGDGEISTCHVCGIELPSQEELARHLMEVHQEDVLPERQGEA